MPISPCPIAIVCSIKPLQTITVLEQFSLCVCVLPDRLSSLLAANPTVTKTFPESAPTMRSSGISIYGSDFFQSETFYCIFGDVQVNASWVNSAHINCTTPVIMTQEKIDLEISVDGLTSVPAGSLFFYGILGQPCCISID
jgi:hypothetical protein